MLRAFLLASVLSLAVGCAGPATQLRRQNRALDRELAEARAELRKERRKNRELENENVVLRDRLGEGADERPRTRRASKDEPDLPVEVLAPEPDEGDEVEDVVYDDSDVVYDASDFDLGGDDDLEYAPDDDDPPPPPPKKTKPRKSSARTAYDKAVAKVKAHDRDGAITALRAFLDEHPGDDLADNAQYWLGEVYYDDKDWARAIVEFRATVERYPKGNKVPDALLKMGFCFSQLGQDTKARAALQEVLDSYPGTQPATLAAAKLEELQ